GEKGDFSPVFVSFFVCAGSVTMFVRKSFQGGFHEFDRALPRIAVALSKGGDPPVLRGKFGGTGRDPELFHAQREAVAEKYGKGRACFLETRWGKGKAGRRSRLYFRCSLKKALLSHMEDLLRRGRYREAVDWIKREGLPAEVRDACFRKLLLEFSFPRIDWTDCIRMMEQSSGRFKPVLISSASGKWMIVEDERSPAATPGRTRFSRMIKR